MRPLLALVLVAIPAAATAQAASISPGMTRAQVIAALGQPATARDASDHTYLFYTNACGRSCGMNDLVILRRDSVVDAIFRSSSRTYTGTSSSPVALSGEAARRRATAPMELPVRKPDPQASSPRKPGVATSTRPSGPAATAQRQATTADVARLRQQLLGAGLTATQIRARLRAEGYREDLLDADMRGAAAAASPMQPGAANDTRPSIPLPDPLRPAGTPAPAPAPSSKPVTPAPATRPPAP